MKGFSVVLKEIEEKAQKSSTWSQNDYATLIAAAMNEKDFKVNFVKGYTKDGKPEMKEVTPVSDFRSELVKQIKKHGKMTQEEAEALVEKIEYGPSAGEALYHISSECIEAYGRTGKGYKLPTKEDMKATIIIAPQGAQKGKERKSPRTGETITTSDRGAFMKVKVRSTCPRNLVKKSK